jgi:hypothetical protein
VDEEGFLFHTLLKRRPDLKEGLARFRHDLIQNVSVAEGMKEWFFKDLGVQASQLLGRSQHPLSTMAEMSQDFPVRAYPLTKISVNATLKKALKATQSRYGQVRRRWRWRRRGGGGFPRPQQQCHCGLGGGLGRATAAAASVPLHSSSSSSLESAIYLTTPSVCCLCHAICLRRPHCRLCRAFL